LHGAAADGRVVFRRRLMRDQLSAFVLQQPPCRIAMEACASAHHWARHFASMGHHVQLISPQFVKPFVKGNKNDGNDAEAICEAMQRPNMRFVPVKSVEQQDIQSLHRIRSRLVNERTGLVCQIRGILAERGIVFAKSISRAHREFPVIAQDLNNPLTPMLRQMMTELIEELRMLDERINCAFQNLP
jgi:transposase